MLLGISTKKYTKTIITDNDIIETSNINRQFLFRNNNIRKPKFKIDTEKAKTTNKHFNCNYLENFVNEVNEHYFNENFYEAQCFILIVVDIKTTQKYIGNKCTKYTKHLIYTDTFGKSWNGQIIVPFKIICSNDKQDLSEYSITLYTLWNIRSKIGHCLDWGLNKFNELFNNLVEDLKTFLDNKDEYFNNIEKTIQVLW